MRRGPSMGLTGRYSRLSRPGAQPVTSKSKLLSIEMLTLRSGGVQVDSGENCRGKGRSAGPGGKVDAPELSSGPGWEIQEVSRVGAEGVTSKSKLLAREMPRVCSGGLRECKHINDFFIGQAAQYAKAPSAPCRGKRRE